MRAGLLLQEDRLFLDARVLLALAAAPLSPALPFSAEFPPPSIGVLSSLKDADSSLLNASGEFLPNSSSEY